MVDSDNHQWAKKHGKAGYAGKKERKWNKKTQKAIETETNDLVKESIESARDEEERYQQILLEEISRY